jgi:hypothetical protein
MIGLTFHASSLQFPASISAWLQVLPAPPHDSQAPAVTTLPAAAAAAAGMSAGCAADTAAIDTGAAAAAAAECTEMAGI